MEVVNDFNYGNIEDLMVFLNHGGKVNKYIYFSAAKKGDVECLEILHAHTRVNFEHYQRLAEIAVRNIRENVVLWLLGKNLISKENVKVICRLAVKYNCLKVLNFIKHDENIISYFAAKYDKVHILNSVKTIHKKALRVAIKYSNISCVKYLIDNNVLCSSKHLLLAASKSNSECLRYILESRHVEINFELIYASLRSGRFENVKVLVEHAKNKHQYLDIKKCINYAALECDIASLHFLTDNLLYFETIADEIDNNSNFSYDCSTFTENYCVKYLNINYDNISLCDSNCSIDDYYINAYSDYDTQSES